MSKRSMRRREMERLFAIREAEGLSLRDVLRAVSTTPASEVSTLTPRAWKERKASEAAPELSVDRAIQDVVEELIGRA